MSYWRNRSAWLEDNSKHSVKVDPKPARRVVDREALWRFHGHNPVCLCCKGSKPEAHHSVHRSQGGDDHPGNLIPLCQDCHGAVHGRPYTLEGVRIMQEDVKHVIAVFLRSDLGEDHCAYLIRKLGPFGAEAFVQRLEGTVRL